MANDESILKPDGFTGIVPYFYYDLIGRIGPGVYLLLAGYWVFKNRLCVESVSEKSLSFSLAAMLIFGLASYAISFIIGPGSYWLWDWSCRFGEKEMTKEVTALLTKNQIELPVGKGRELHRSIVSRSELCVYRLWLRAPALAVMCSRWDAETFAARQFGMATFILVVITTWLRIVGQPPAHYGLVLCVALLAIFLSYNQFRYLRRKAILARFMMLSCVPSEPGPVASA